MTSSLCIVNGHSCALRDNKEERTGGQVWWKRSAMTEWKVFGSNLRAALKALEWPCGKEEKKGPFGMEICRFVATTTMPRRGQTMSTMKGTQSRQPL